MTVSRMYLTLLVASAVAGCLLRLLGKGVAGFSSAGEIGHTTGQVLSLFLVTALVPTISVLLIRKKEPAGALTAVGLLILVAFSYFSYRAIEFRHTLAASTLSAGEIFSPEACDFAVVFPSQPRIISVIVPELGEIPEAEISDPRGLMRANCIGASDLIPNRTIAFYDNRELLLRAVQAHAEQNGLSNLSYFHDDVDLGIRASARGTKQIDGRWVTYETIWFVSPRSVMTLMTGHLSESYPTPEISRFISSVTRNDLRK